VPDTLLGPEGSGNRTFTTATPAEFTSSGASVGALVARRTTRAQLGQALAGDQDTRPYLENCTVDASI
jgi:hypothetical protein